VYEFNTLRVASTGNKPQILFLIAIKYLGINQVQKIQRKNKKKFESVVILVHGTQRSWLLVQGMRHALVVALSGQTAVRCTANRLVGCGNCGRTCPPKFKSST
jgi:hypothetical protein